VELFIIIPARVGLGLSKFLSASKLFNFLIPQILLPKGKINETAFPDPDACGCDYFCSGAATR
jgi:hypothetical protein